MWNKEVTKISTDVLKFLIESEHESQKIPSFFNCLSSLWWKVVIFFAIKYLFCYPIVEHLKQYQKFSFPSQPEIPSLICIFCMCPSDTVKSHCLMNYQLLTATKWSQFLSCFAFHQTLKVGWVILLPLRGTGAGMGKWLPLKKRKTGTGQRDCPKKGQSLVSVLGNIPGYFNLPIVGTNRSQWEGKPALSGISAGFLVIYVTEKTLTWLFILKWKNSIFPYVSDKL